VRETTGQGWGRKEGRKGRRLEKGRNVDEGSKLLE
jgi:hypothetical protein